MAEREWSPRPAASGCGCSVGSGCGSSTRWADETGDLHGLCRGRQRAAVERSQLRLWRQDLSFDRGRAVVRPQPPDAFLTIIADEVGRHDFLYAPCSLRDVPDAVRRTEYRPNCHDNLRAALRELGIEPDPLPNAFNLFMNSRDRGRRPAGHRAALVPAPATQSCCAPRWDLAVAISILPGLGLQRRRSAATVGLRDPGGLRRHLRAAVGEKPMTAIFISTRA